MAADRLPSFSSEERSVYSLISSHDGIKAREIASLTGLDRSDVNHILFSSPLMHELCFQDQSYCWHALIRQGSVHEGLYEFSGWYGTVREFMRAAEDEWLSSLSDVSFHDWEIVFELRINRARMIRIYADVLVVTPTHVFSLEFKMKDTVDPAEVLQAAKYCPFLEVVFGSRYEVVPALVLTAAADLFEFVPIGSTDMILPVASGDMLFNVFNEYLCFLH